MSNAKKALLILKKVPFESCTRPIEIHSGAENRHSTGESEAFIYKTLKGEAIVKLCLALNNAVDGSLRPSAGVGCRRRGQVGKLGFKYFLNAMIAYWGARMPMYF